MSSFLASKFKSACVKFYYSVSTYIEILIIKVFFIYDFFHTEGLMEAVLQQPLVHWSTN